MPLSAHALITTQGLQARLKRASSGEDDIEQRLIDAVNGATGYLERATRRRLRARNYRTAVTLTGTALVSATALTVATTTLKAGDDVVGTGIAPGSQLASITSASAAVLSRTTTAAITSGSLTFGSRPLVLSGEGERSIYAPEFPLVELFAAYARDSGGTRTALDITGASYDYDTGHIVLDADIFPRGLLNIDLECRAGYVAPSATDLGSADWYDLEALAYRVGEIFYTDALNIRGRYESAGAGGMSASVGTGDMPADVVAGVTRFLRRWA